MNTGKSSIRHNPLDYPVDAANRVRQHPEWRLLLVTADDVSRELPRAEEGDLPSWSQLRADLARVTGIETSGDHWAATLVTWSLLEAILRRRCIDEQLPIYRLPTPPLLKEMYSRGELSVSQYDALMAALPARNEAAHGFVSDRIHTVDVELRGLASTLLDEWQPAGSVV